MSEVSLELFKETYQKYKDRKISLEEFTKFLDFYIPEKENQIIKQNQEIKDYGNKIIFFKSQIVGLIRKLENIQSEFSGLYEKDTYLRANAFEEDIKKYDKSQKGLSENQ